METSYNCVYKEKLRNVSTVLNLAYLHSTVLRLVWFIEERSI